MDKKKKVVSREFLQEVDSHGKTAEKHLTNLDLLTMQNVIIQFKDEIEDESNLSIIFHVSIIWHTSISNPEIKVSIRIKDNEQNDDVASWEKIMHNFNINGWELTFGQVIKSAKEMKIDYMIVENVQSYEQKTRWLQ